MKKVLHVMRSPVGGLFRHVCDLVREQSKLGWQAGIICDDLTGGAAAETRLEELSVACALGIHRLTMPRLPSLKDVSNIGKVRRLATSHGCDVIHGHGAKGGLYARLAARSLKVPSVYTPHGGSLHYEWTSPQGAVFLSMEWLLARSSANVIFVCAFERDLFFKKLGKPGGTSTVIHNGLTAAEFSPVPLAKDASNFLFVGEMRHLKGVDVLLNAIAKVPRATLTLVGAGSDQGEFEALVTTLRLDDRVRFLGPMAMRKALEAGAILVVPSRNESYPYVVLEALAAGRQVIASAVGGIPEILPQNCLFEAGTIEGLRALLAGENEKDNNFSGLLVERRARLELDNTVQAMAGKTCQFYGQLTKLTKAK